MSKKLLVVGVRKGGKWRIRLSLWRYLCATALGAS